MDEIDSVLNSTQAKFSKDSEIERILGCYEHDYFALLEVPWDSDNIPLAAKKAYRRKTLLVHPDKVQHEGAAKSFDLLRKAERVLTSEEGESQADERARLVAIYKDVASHESSELEASSDALARKVEVELAQLLKEEQIEKDYQKRQEEKKVQEANRQQLAREQKKKNEVKWEDNRDKRVNQWREYTAKVEKKKKKKRAKVLA